MIEFLTKTSTEFSSLQISSDERIIYITDAELVYIEKNGVRTQFRDIIYLNTQSDLPIAPLNKIYFTIDDRLLRYFYNGTWLILNENKQSSSDENEINQYYLNIKHNNLSSVEENTLSINFKVNREDAIIYEDLYIDNNNMLNLCFNSIDLNSFTLDKVKTIQFWIPIKNAISYEEDLSATLSIEVPDDLEIIDIDSFPLILKRKQYDGNQAGKRIYVFVLRFIPLIGGKIKKTINYSHYFDVVQDII